MIYIDQLSLKTIILAYKIVKKSNKDDKQHNILVIDPINITPYTWLLIKGMHLCGISIKEAEFFSGDLRTMEGNSIFSTAKHILIKIAFESAEKCVNSSSIISNLNKIWRRDTLMLYISKCIWLHAGIGGCNTIFKILVADALCRKQSDKKSHLIIGVPDGITPDQLNVIKLTLPLYTYSINNLSIRESRVSVLLLIVYLKLKRLIKFIKSRFAKPKVYGSVNIPAILLYQESDLSMDRSYRGQPHWLFEKDGPPNYRTLIIQSSIYKIYDKEKLKQNTIHPFSKDDMVWHYENHPINSKLDVTMRTLLYQSLFGARCDVGNIFLLAKLFGNAKILANFCLNQNIKVFMTCENYVEEANAMNLIAPQMGIRTLSYQYSNLSEINPSLFTTADTLATFSPLFHERWTNNKIRPQSFINIGYLLDSAFVLVEERAKKLRNKIMSCGANFIICYYDENVQTYKHKYGLIRIKDHYQELLSLAKLVLKDPKIGVIIKTQYRKNSPTVMFKKCNVIKSANKTGRFVDLHKGERRNNILPSESAMSSDIVIGHAIGATAALEAALTGTRCILINPTDVNGSNIKIFQKAGILFRNLDSALEVINYFREGIDSYGKIGDWHSIINLFDEYKDRDSSTRLRKIVENALIN